MSLDDATRARIESLIQQNPVLLFMKGERGRPQCGFSATVVGILDGLVADYATVDVLSDPAIREGIKAFSSWPTIPQLYVGGEFIGGCDIVQELAGAGELADVLGVQLPPPGTLPAITITPAAAKALAEASQRAPEGAGLHLAIDARFQNKLFFGPPQPDDVVVAHQGVELRLDRLSAARADGVTIDAVDAGFRIDNPNAPGAAVGSLSVSELRALLDSGEPLELFDVRTPEERAKASIPGSRLMTEAEAQRIGALPKDTRLVFHCHHGGRSQAAAEHFAALGYTAVFNVVGGIDAWSREIDPSVPRY